MSSSSSFGIKSLNDIQTKRRDLSTKVSLQFDEDSKDRSQKGIRGIFSGSSINSLEKQEDKLPEKSCQEKEKLDRKNAFLQANQ